MSQSNAFAVSSPTERSRIRSLLSKALDARLFPELILTRRAGWIALPIESSAHFDEDGVKSVVNAIRRYERRNFYAVALESLVNSSEVLRFPATQYGVEAFNHLCGHFNFVMFTEAVDWLLICSTDDYYIAVGNEDFAREVCGGTIQQGYYSFEEYINRSPSSSRSRKLLSYVYDKCRLEYPQVPVGSQMAM